MLFIRPCCHDEDRQAARMKALKHGISDGSQWPVRYSNSTPITLIARTNVAYGSDATLKKCDINCVIIPQLIISSKRQRAYVARIPPGMGFRLGDGLRSSASEAIDGRSEYQVPHNAATDISRCHAKREEQTTETDEQTQRIAKQDEKARRRHTEKRRITQSKADQKDKAIQQQTENIHTHNQSRKPKTIPTKKKPCASCTLLRG